jgi:hypothetical protein
MSHKGLTALLIGAALAAGSLVVPFTGLGQLPGRSTAYRAPRTPDGKPDFRGIWEVRNRAGYNVEDHSGDVGILPGKGVVDGGAIPYRPEALEKRKANYKDRAKLDPLSKCYMAGVPRTMYLPFPFQIFQGPGWVAILSEYAHTYRYIRTDGSKHLEGAEFWMGDSRGRWEGDTLVIDVVSFTDQTWLDMSGNFHSADLHVVERFTRTAADTLTYEVLIEDPKTFTRPWKMSMPIYLHKEPDAQILEWECYSYGVDASPVSEKP